MPKRLKPGYYTRGSTYLDLVYLNDQREFKFLYLALKFYYPATTGEFKKIKKYYV